MRKRMRNLSLKSGDKIGNWIMVADPVWTERNSQRLPVIKARCLCCNNEYERIAYQFTHKNAKHGGCVTCTKRNAKKSIVVNGEKFCTKCKLFKSLDEFHNDRSRSDGKFAWCKYCANTATGLIKRKERHRRTERFMRTSRKYRDRMNFGSDTLFDELMALQENRCAVCKREYSYDMVPRFHIDHCHKNRIVRGVLCSNCNKGLGYAGDSAEILLAMIEYLRNNAGIPIVSGAYSKPDDKKV